MCTAIRCRPGTTSPQVPQVHPNSSGVHSRPVTNFAQCSKPAVAQITSATYCSLSPSRSSPVERRSAASVSMFAGRGWVISVSRAAQSGSARAASRRATKIAAVRGAGRGLCRHALLDGRPQARHPVRSRSKRLAAEREFPRFPTESVAGHVCAPVATSVNWWGAPAVRQVC